MVILNEKNSRKSENHPEIVKILNDVKIKRERVLIWQTNVNNQRNINNGFVTGVDTNLGSISLSPVKTDQPFDFDKMTSVFLRGDREGILFKQDLIIASPNMLIVKIPEIVNVVEKRNSPRSVYNIFDNRNIVLQKLQVDSEKTLSFSFQLVNLSNSGVAFNIASQHLPFVKQGRTFEIKEIDGFLLDNPIISKVLYRHKLKYKSGNRMVKAYRVGVKFLSKLSPDILQKILEKKES